MSIYVCSDIHGKYDELLQMLENIMFSKEDKLYVLGDVIDRGPDSLKTLKYIMESDNIEMIVGNHELAMLDYYRGDSVYDSWADHEWFSFGGNSTRKEMLLVDKELKNKLLDYIESLPFYKIVGEYILVHGGFDIFDKNNPEKKEILLDVALKMNNADSITWNRDFFEDDKKIIGYKTIMGHTPTSDFGESNIIFKNDKILIDCGCVFGGKLACLRLDDMQEFYI